MNWFEILVILLVIGVGFLFLGFKLAGWKKKAQVKESLPPLLKTPSKIVSGVPRPMASGVKNPPEPPPGHTTIKILKMNEVVSIQSSIKSPSERLPESHIKVLKVNEAAPNF